MTELWTDQLEAALAGYGADLLRQVAARLLKTRNQWPAEELIERIRDATDNAAVIDRRLKDLPPSARKILDLIGLSRRPDWKAGDLLQMLAALGHSDGPTPLQVLFDEGLIYPLRPAGSPKLLFVTPLPGVGRNRFAVTRDGQRFLVITWPEVAPAPINVVVNWLAELKR